MPTKRVPIYELQVGMYVTKLDLSWFRSPFLRHSFLIEQMSQIERLIRAGVKMVEIDPDQGTDSRTGGRNPAAVTPKDTAPPVTTPALSPPPLKSLAQLNEEYAQAKLAKKQLEQAVHSVFSACSQNRAVDAQRAAEAVQEITIVTRTIPNSAIFMALSQNRGGNSTLSQHALATCTLSLVLGQALEFNPLELQELATAALLHDVGLLRIPEVILQRCHTTSSPLSPRQQQQLETHPRLSILMLERQGGFETAMLHLIGNHHAYLNGSGYPKEARGEFTSARTRILMIADKYDELITGFGGASPLAPHQALQRLYEEAREGILDREILSRLIKVVGIYPVHSYVQLNTKEIAVVTNLNPDRLHQPVVTITHDPQGAGYPTPLIVDLAHQEHQPGKRTIDAVLESQPSSAVHSHAA